MPILISLPILGMLLVLQSAVLSRIPLLQGTPDLMLLALLAWATQKRVDSAWHWAVIGGAMYSYVSAVPLGAPFAGCLAAVALARFMQRRIMQAPVLVMLLATFFGTLAMHMLILIALQFAGAPLPWVEALNLITLPSMLLNLLLAIPMYILAAGLAKRVYPETYEMV